MKQDTMNDDPEIHPSFVPTRGGGGFPVYGQSAVGNSAGEILYDAGGNTPSSPAYDEHAPVIALVHDLLDMPDSQTNLERSGGRYRLRFKIADPETGRMVRRALELPEADDLAASVAGIIHAHRHARAEDKAAIRRHDAHQWRKDIRRRLLAACPHGRVVKRRLVLVFEIAVILGYVFLKDFMSRRPWLAKSPFHPGRRPKRA
jgi:hypothetical protein